jgi:hypothetical protein
VKHEELLAHIDDYIYNYGLAGHKTSMFFALRAVVEMHKPEQRCYDATCYCKDMCSKCKEDYPCQTIQSIEKELV